MQNGLASYSQQRYELRITAFQTNTIVNITVLGGIFKQNLTSSAGTTISVALPESVENRGSLTFSNSVHVTSNKPINILSLNHRFRSAETSIVYPLDNLGTTYYLITPKQGSTGSYKAFSVIASKEDTSVDIYLKGVVEFKGLKYPANSVLTVRLAAFEGIQLLSSDDLSGSKVKSEKPVAVLSGHTCAIKNTQCSHVFEQLMPVDLWGKSFYVAPFSFQTKSDIVFIVAAGNTEVSYDLGTNERSISMVDGQVQEIEMPGETLSITASSPIQVMSFNTGGTVRRFNYNPSIMNILDTGSYCSSYYIYGQRDIDNYAIIIAKNVSVNGITFGGLRLKNPVWQQIHGTDYMWLQYYFGTSFISNMVQHPTDSFGLQSIGVGVQFSYGSPGSCIK
ncbi:Hypothetical predicted protein, partial [Pelobates cultripes]